MSPSKKCKEAGLSSLAELSQISTVSRETLNNWFKHKPVVFQLVLEGAVRVKEKRFVNNILLHLGINHEA